MAVSPEPVALGDVPANLPVASLKTAATEDDDTLTTAYTDYADDSETEVTVEMKSLEDQAHESHVLLSSDAIRHFLTVAGGDKDQALAMVLERAHATYPSEDGWVVLNLSRMQELLSTHTATLAADTPLGIGSLAEAIVRKDVNAAYRMIEHRPMVALSDAAADLDAVYRERLTGERADTISDLLRESVSGLSTEALETIIRALTSAVDGTYHDEHEAVKMAIMKAVSGVDGK